MSAETVIPRADDESCTPTQAGYPGPFQKMAEAGHMGLPQEVTQPGFTGQPQAPQPILLPNWYQQSRKRSRLLLELGTYHVLISLAHLVFGTYLLAVAKNLHLVVLRWWYPFWGAASFFISGSLVIALEVFRKTCAAAHIVPNTVSFACALAGIVALAKDLFLESPYRFPLWIPYPNDTIHIQRLELALLCFTFLELFLPWALAIIAYTESRRRAKEDVSLIPDVLLEPSGLSPSAPSIYLNLPPSYEEAIIATWEGDGAKPGPRLNLYPPLSGFNQQQQLST